MDEIELEIAIAEEEARAKQKSIGFGGPVDMDVSLSERTDLPPDPTKIGSSVDMGISLAERSDLPPDIGNINSQYNSAMSEAVTKTDDLMAEGYNQAAGFSNKLLLEGLGTAVMPMSKVPEAASLATRAGIYGVNALKGSLGLEAGTTIADAAQTGNIKSPSEMGQSVATNTLIGAGAPLSVEAVGSAGQWIKNLFNKAPVVAKNLGATAVDLNPNAEKYVVPKVQELIDNSDFFNKNILTATDPGKQWERAKGYRDVVGKQIGDFYASNGALPVLRDDIVNSPEIQKLISITQNPNLTAPTRAEAQQALDLLNSGLQNSSVLNLADVWQLRKDLDSQLVSSLFKKGTGEVTNYSEYVLDAANGVRSSMEQAIARVTSDGTKPGIAREVADRLLKNKEEFSNINAITEILGRKVGQTSGTTVIEKVINNPIKYPLRSLNNQAGAFAATAGNIGAGMSSVAPIFNPYANMGSTLFPRSTDPNEINLKQLMESVFTEALKIAPPDQAQMLVEQIDQTFTSGNPIAKREVMANLTMQFPNLFEPNPEGLIGVINNEYSNPFEKDIVVKESLNLPATERAKRIGASFQNKYIPPTETPIAQPSPRPSPQIDLPSLSSGMDEAFASPAPQQSSDLTSMLNQLTNAEAEHFANDYGIIQ